MTGIERPLEDGDAVVREVFREHREDVCDAERVRSALRLVESVLGDHAERVDLFDVGDDHASLLVWRSMASMMEPTTRSWPLSVGR